MNELAQGLGMHEEEIEAVELIPPPSRSGKLTNQQILWGQKHDPIEVLKIYTSDEWEQFIREWAENLRERYAEVRRASGAGDKGRDVIGYVEAVNCPAYRQIKSSGFRPGSYPLPAKAFYF
jgi:hypothetical protein